MSFLEAEGSKLCFNVFQGLIVCRHLKLDWMCDTDKDAQLFSLNIIAFVGGAHKRQDFCEESFSIKLLVFQSHELLKFLFSNLYCCHYFPFKIESKRRIALKGLC